MFMEQDSSRLRRFLISGIIFLLIAGMIMANSVAFQLFDSMLQGFFTTGGQTEFKTMLMKLISTLGSPKMAIVYVVIIGFLLWGFKYKIPALWSIATLGSGDIVAFLVKNIVKRARPVQHLVGDDGFSFPSGHVFGMFIIAAILFLVVLPNIKSGLWRLVCQILLIIYLILLAVSRVYLFATILVM
ncbi:phosphatase PAP2 family protein [Paucilactobacillus hokkaidonensis]|uniref:phosphatase PAP2 family protein n=1 Tax=Paucilactobacillus hokkaidonensis TaxID=1193095 RepID=UPI000AF0547A